MENKKPNIFYFYILTLYFVLSIVNWLPILDNNVVRILKYIIFIYIFLYELFLFGLKEPSNFLSRRGLLLILVSMLPGIALSFDYTPIVDILIPFLMLWIFNYKKQFYFKVLYNASMVVALMCIFSIMAYYTGLFDMTPNGPWTASFGASGFGGYRTGYSNSLFLFIPFLVFWHRVKRKSIISHETIIIFLILITQYISGGRAGILASLVVIIIWLRISIPVKAIMFALVLIAFQSESVQEQLRVIDYDTDDEAINKLSSGRFFLNTYYFTKFQESPLFGYGFGEKPSTIIMGTEAHIVWLRNVIDGGIFYLALLFYVFIEIYRKAKNNKTLTVEEKKLFYSIFLTTLIITFLEPNYLIGSVQGEVVYWLIISLILKTHNPIVLENLRKKVDN